MSPLCRGINMKYYDVLLSCDSHPTTLECLSGLSNLREHLQSINLVSKEHKNLQIEIYRMIKGHYKIGEFSEINFRDFPI